MTEKRIQHEVKYTFSRAELLELGEELALATDEVADIESRKKQMTADLAADLKRANGTVFRLARKVKDRYEYREVECIAAFGVPRAGLKTLRRADNNEEIETLPMTPDEMQQGLDFGTTAEGTAETPTQ